MGALVGFVVGYLMGTKAGPGNLDEIRKAWTTISASEEFKGLTATAMSLIGGVAKQRFGR